MTKDISHISTPRLQGEAICEKHWAIWRKMSTNPQLMSTLGGVWDSPTAWERLTKNIEHWEENDMGLWMFYDNYTNEFVGRCGLRRLKINGKNEVELSYSVLPHYWRQGFAYEMSQAAIKIGFSCMNLQSIVGFTLPTNIASIKTLQKLEFIFEKNIVHESLEHVLHRKKN